MSFMSLMPPMDPPVRSSPSGSTGSYIVSANILCWLTGDATTPIEPIVLAIAQPGLGIPHPKPTFVTGARVPLASPSANSGRASTMGRYLALLAPR